MTSRRRGGVKRREADLACDQFLKCSLHPEYPKRFTEWGREEKGEGGNRCDLGEIKESQEGERAIKPVITPR